MITGRSVESTVLWNSACVIETLYNKTHILSSGIVGRSARAPRCLPLIFAQIDSAPRQPYTGMMNSRERIRAAFQHRSVDRVPVDLTSRSSAIEVEPYDRLKVHLGIQEPTRRFLRDHAELHPTVMELFGVDVEYVRWFGEEMYEHRANGDIVFHDEWGVDWRKAVDGHYYELDNRRFSGLTLEQISWPERIVSDDQLLRMRETAEKHAATERAVFCDYVGPCVFERSWYLRGLDDFLMDLLSEPEFAAPYIERIATLQYDAYERILAAFGDKIDGFFIIDDIAMQSGPMISPDLYRTMIKPHHRRIFELIHRHNKKVIYHSCGAVIDLIPDLIEIGIDALNPLQLSADRMDPVVLKREYGRDLVFWGGGCSTQSTLTFGTPQEVRDEVLFRLDVLARDGGYVFTAEHCIQPGTPVENLLTMMETVLSF